MINKDIDKYTPADAPVPGLYQHYKGQYYRVLGVARHSETDEWLVVYQALYAERGFWLRPLAIWLKPVNSDALQGSSTGTDTGPSMRFKLIESSELTLSQLTKQVKGARI